MNQQAQIVPIIEDTKAMDNTLSTVDLRIAETPATSDSIQEVEEPAPEGKPRRSRRTKKAE